MARSALSSYPAAMLAQGFVKQQAVEGIEVFGQGHFIEQAVDAVVTLPAQINAAG